MGQPGGHALEQPVAGIVAMGIIHFFEFVQVEHDDRHQVGLPLGLGQGHVQPVEKEGPVGQAVR